MSAEIDSELRRRWRQDWLSSICELSHMEWQRELWGKSNNPHHSFVEYVDCYWNDLNLEGGYESWIEKGFLLSTEADLAARFHALVGAYKAPNDDYDHDSILADPDWNDVVSAAAKTRDGLLEMSKDSAEREKLLRTRPLFP